MPHLAKLLSAYIDVQIVHIQRQWIEHNAHRSLTENLKRACIDRRFTSTSTYILCIYADLIIRITHSRLATCTSSQVHCSDSLYARIVVRIIDYFKCRQKAFVFFCIIVPHHRWLTLYILQGKCIFRVHKTEKECIVKLFFAVFFMKWLASNNRYREVIAP